MAVKDLPIIHKNIQAYIIKADEALGQVSAVVNCLGIVDLGGDVIEKNAFVDFIARGAFRQTMHTGLAKVRILDNHNTDSVLRAVGKPLEIKELTKTELPPEVLSAFPRSTGALFARMQFMMDDPNSLAVFKRIQAGVITEWSIGLSVVQSKYEKRRDNDGNEVNARVITECALWDISPVLWGMSPATITTDIKSDTPTDEPDTKGAISKQDVPLASRDMAWDAGSANKAVQAWADGDMNKFKQAFLWVDPDNTDKIGGYKLPYATVAKGRLLAVPKGLFAAAAALQGSRGGVDIPEGDQEKVKAVISKWYTAMAKEFDDTSIVAPWDKDKNKGSGRSDVAGGWEAVEEETPQPDVDKEMTPDGAQMRLGDMIASDVHGVMMGHANGCLSMGFISKDQHAALCDAAGTMKDMVYQTLGDLSDYPIGSPRGGGMGGMIGGWSQHVEDLLTKAGRTISADTGSKIQGAMDSIEAALETLEALLTDSGVTGNAEDEEEGTAASKTAEPPPQAGSEPQPIEAQPSTRPVSTVTLEAVQLLELDLMEELHHASSNR